VHRLFFCSFRQSQTISAQKAAVSVAAGTAIGSQFVIAFHKTHEAVPYMRTAEAYAKNGPFLCAHTRNRNFTCRPHAARFHFELFDTIQIHFR
jgi:hypothetical protein